MMKPLRRACSARSAWLRTAVCAAAIVLTLSADAQTPPPPAVPLRSGDVLTPEDWARLRGGSQGGAAAHQGSEIFGTAAPSVVFIYNKLKPRGGKPGGVSSGTGSVITQDGLILTNQHVIEDSDALYVAFFPTGTLRELTPDDLREARLVRFDESRDLALIRLVQPPGGLRPLPFGDFTALKVGEEVHAIGHPLGNTWTYTKGVVSQIRDKFSWEAGGNFKRQASVIQTQTPISPGNSGGPLLDGAGRMVGVNSFVTTGPAQGLNFAVAVSEVEQFLNERGNKLAQRAAPKKQAPENCKNGDPKVVKTYRNSTDDHTFIDIDVDCDGAADITMRIPDRNDLAVRYTIERDGRTVVVLVDMTRSEKIDYSLHDTDGDGVPDSIGVHPDGAFKAASFVPYTGEASVRAVLEKQRGRK